MFLCGFYALNSVFHFSFYHDQATTFNIAIIHTVFNVVTTAILLPFNKLLVRLAILTVPDSKEPQQNSLLDERLLSTPAVAVNRSMLVGGDMAEICRTSLLQAMSTTRKWTMPLPMKSAARKTPSTITRTFWAPTWCSCPAAP